MKNDWSKFASYIRRLMTENNVADAAGAVSKNGKVSHKNGFGYRDLEDRKLVTEDTIFGIATITISFTALSIMKLESEGKLSIDDPV
ncbi:serine hydrolase domain-containing protein, partial [Virgibacillus salexigens]|uniref:serine hydrolase domain-containing protein n=1 Tax=Virgibacillus salexigens TaxID=61016 RepID=UPI00308191C9